MNQAILIILSFIILTHSIASAGLKKVMLLDFKNIRNEKSYNYLEATITDAIRSKLTEKFAFKEANKEKWSKVAQTNFIFEKDLYTDTAALNLALLSKQDLVIYGGFFAKQTKKSKKLITKVSIADVSTRKIIASFEKVSPINAKIFKSVKEIADRIAKDAESVLPNKEEWARSGGQDNEEEKLDSYNQISLFGGYHALAISPAKAISQNNTVVPTDLGSSLAFGFEFQRFGVFTNNLSAYGQFEFQTLNGEVSAENLTGTIPATLQAFSGNVGLAFRHFLGSKIYTQVFMGGGLSQTAISLKYSESVILATNTSGSEETLKEYSSLVPLIKTGLRFGYVATPWLSIELAGNYNHLIYSGGGSQTVSGELRAGFML